MGKMISNNDKYYDRLLEQFLKARGIKISDLSSSTFISDFADWLNLMKNIGEKYLQFLYEIASKDIIDNAKTFEIGKGIKDTIVEDLSTSMITPYADDFYPLNKKKIIPGEFIIYRGKPSVYKIGECSDPVRMPRGRYAFMIQNPTKNDLLNWDYMRNSSDHIILVGVYGMLKDKDYAEKIALLKNFRKQLVGQIKMEYFEDDNNYYYLLNGERQEKFIKEINFRM